MDALTRIKGRSNAPTNRSYAGNVSSRPSSNRWHTICLGGIGWKNWLRRPITTCASQKRTHRKHEDREQKKSQLECELRKLALTTNQDHSVSSKELERVLRVFLKKLKAQPLSVRLELSKLFPDGITLFRPGSIDTSHDAWIAQVNMESAELIYFDAYKVGVKMTPNQPPFFRGGHGSINKALCGADGT
jgi:hypothetical protein